MSTDPLTDARPTGPAPFGLLLGLALLALAVGLWVTTSFDLTVDWGVAGPAVLVGGGLVLALLGGLGLRRRH